MLAEHATDMISQHTEDGVFVYVSPVCRRLLGYDPRHMLGHSVCDFVHVEDIPKLKRRQDAIVAVPAPNTLVFRARRRDGTYVWVETCAKAIAAVPGDGQAKEIIAITRDISERKRAEETVKERRELHRYAIHGMMQGVAVVDRDLVCRLWNPFMEQLTGRKAEEVLGTRISDLFPFTEAAGIGPRVPDVLKGQTVISPDTRCEALGAAQTGWTVQTASPLRNADDEISGIIVTVNDITQRKLREEKRP
jgi:PAS domain S-box-containing protein